MRNIAVIYHNSILKNNNPKTPTAIAVFFFMEMSLAWCSVVEHCVFNMIYVYIYKYDDPLIKLEMSKTVTMVILEVKSNFFESFCILNAHPYKFFTLYLEGKKAKAEKV